MVGNSIQRVGGGRSLTGQNQGSAISDFWSGRLIRRYNRPTFAQYCKYVGRFPKAFYVLSLSTSQESQISIRAETAVKPHHAGI